MSDENISERNKTGSKPVTLNLHTTHELYKVFHSYAAIKIAQSFIKDQLFSVPFQVRMGNDGKTFKGISLTPYVLKEVISKYWLTFCQNVLDWLFMFGICPYYMSRVKIKKQEPRTLSKTKRKRKNKRKRKDIKETNEEETDDDGEEEESDEDEDEWHNYWVVPQFGSGFIATYIDENGVQRFLWTWKHDMIPQKADGSRRDYVDLDMRWCIRDKPNLNGDYTSLLFTIYSSYNYVESRRKIHQVLMKGELNQMYVIEKDNKVNQPSKTTTENLETSARNSSSFALQSNRIANLSVDVSGANGFTDAGISGYQNQRFYIDQESVVNTIEENSGRNYDRYSTKDKFFVGRSDIFNGQTLDDNIAEDLYYNNSQRIPSMLINPVNGVGVQTYRLDEGEKMTGLEHKNLKESMDKDSILDGQKYIDIMASIMIGYPLLELMDSKSQKTSSVSQSKAVREHCMAKIKQHKQFFREFLRDTWVLAYADTLNDAFRNSQKRMRPNEWHMIENALNIEIIFPPSKNYNDMDDLIRLYETGVINATQFRQYAREALDLDESYNQTLVEPFTSTMAVYDEQDDKSSKDSHKNNNRLEMLYDPIVKTREENRLELDKQEAMFKLEVKKERELKLIEFEHQKRLLSLQLEMQKRQESTQTIQKAESSCETKEKENGSLIDASDVKNVKNSKNSKNAKPQIIKSKSKQDKSVSKPVGKPVRKRKKTDKDNI